MPHVVSLAKKYNAIIHFLYVAQDLSHHEHWYGDFDKSHTSRLIEWEIKKAKNYLHELCRKHLEDYAKYHMHVDVGNPARKIIDFISNSIIDLVVIRRRGES